MTFMSEKPIKAVRKRHQCVGCLKYVEIGQPAVNWVGINDGDFHSVYFHPDCREAEVELNNACRTFGDEWQALHEIDSEDYPWLMAEHTAVYLRLIARPEKKLA